MYERLCAKWIAEALCYQGNEEDDEKTVRKSGMMMKTLDRKSFLASISTLEKKTDTDDVRSQSRAI